MTRLYTYCIPFDDGAAPNPYEGMCTLAICKPVIRRTAQVGDWVVGLGSKHATDGKDHSGKVVYAMRVTEKLGFKEYDAKYPCRIPKIVKGERHLRLGDSLYDCSDTDPIKKTNPKMRLGGVHGIGNYEHDLKGLNVLISTNFVYWGSQPKKLPRKLEPIIIQRQGHLVKRNEPYLEKFENWIKGLDVKWNTLLYEPQFWPFPEDETVDCTSCQPRRESAKEDEELEKKGGC